MYQFQLSSSSLNPGRHSCDCPMTTNCQVHSELGFPVHLPNGTGLTKRGLQVPAWPRSTKQVKLLDFPFPKHRPSSQASSISPTLGGRSETKARSSIPEYHKLSIVRQNAAHPLGPCCRLVLWPDPESIRELPPVLCHPYNCWHQHECSLPGVLLRAMQRLLLPILDGPWQLSGIPPPRLPHAQEEVSLQGLSAFHQRHLGISALEHMLTHFSLPSGMFNESCSNCFNTWDEPDVIQCQCRGHSGQVHQPQFNLSESSCPLRPLALFSSFGADIWLDDVVGTHCGRLTCFDFINQLGTPLNGHPDPPICDIHSDEPSGLKKVPEATPPPGLLYVRRGVVHRQQFPNNSVIETPVTVPAFFALTAPLTASEPTTHVVDTPSTTVLTVTGKPQVWKST
jgi:hypothetical protein